MQKTAFQSQLSTSEARLTLKTIDEYKEHVVKWTDRAHSADRLNSLLNDYQNWADESRDEASRDLWLSERDKLILLKNSDEFKAGGYALGIDELILELIEWRSMIYAFTEVDIKSDPFKTSGFFAQWHAGATYGVFSIYGKLVSLDRRDKSLRKLWMDVSPKIIEDRACTNEEVDHINASLDFQSNRSGSMTSKTLTFRNTHISHNEATPVLYWNEVDQDVGLLIRAWSLLVSWSSFGLHEPFRDADIAFNGLDSAVEPLELLSLKQKRHEYLEKVKHWSRCYAHNGLVDPGRNAFSKMKITMHAS